MHDSYKLSVVNVTSIILIVRTYIGTATQILTIPDIVDYTIIILGICLCLIQIIARKYSRRELTVLAVAGVLILVSALKSKEYTIFYTFLMILLIGKKDLKTFLRRFLKLSICLVMLVTTVYSVELLLGIARLSTKSGIMTFTGGYSTGNVFGFICFWLISLYIYIEYDWLALKKIFFFCVLQFALAYIAGCKTVMVMAAISLVGLLFLKKNWLGERLLTHITKWIFFVVGVMYFGVIQIFSQASGRFFWIVFVIDNFLTGRIRNSALLYDIYGFSVIGQRIQKGNVEFNEFYRLTRVTVDGMYPLLFLQVGIVVFILLSIAFFMISRRHRVTKVEMFFIIMFVFSGLSEMFVANGIMCFPLLFLGRAIYETNEENSLDYGGS